MQKTLVKDWGGEWGREASMKGVLSSKLNTVDNCASLWGNMENRGQIHKRLELVDYKVICNKTLSNRSEESEWGKQENIKKRSKTWSLVTERTLAGFLWEPKDIIDYRWTSFLILSSWWQEWKRRHSPCPGSYDWNRKVFHSLTRSKAFPDTVWEQQFTSVEPYMKGLIWRVCWTALLATHSSEISNGSPSSILEGQQRDHSDL